ncbi:MAG: hypothetical protein H7061_14150 [Bdellovibrionaceae bacterium]|nr:hypothetical protein [Bdellovibrio sp.]
MKISLVTLSFFGFGLICKADMIMPATLDIICTENGGASVIAIVSNESGSAVTINGTSYPGQQLIAGTEGGPAYMQAVNSNGLYNITVTEGDLVQAFNKRTTIENGKANAYVALYSPKRSFEASCEGKFSFKK